jgi:hypothetical protein
MPRSTTYLLCLLAACETPAPARATTAAIANATPACAPYLEATGGVLRVPPDATVIFVEGAALALVGDDPGRVTVAPVASPAWAIEDDGLAVRAWFGAETQLGDGVVARAGATATLDARLDADRLRVTTAHAHLRDAPCAALARRRPPAPPRWDPSSPRELHRATTLVSEAGTPLRDLGPDDVVDLFDVDGARARVRVEADGYLLTGWIDRDALEPVAGLEGDDASELYGGFGLGRSGYGLDAPCAGPAVLRAGAPIATGPRAERGVRALPSIDRDVAIELRAARGDDREVRIVAPAPGVAEVTAWVAVADLDHARCGP